MENKSNLVPFLYICPHMYSVCMSNVNLVIPKSGKVVYKSHSCSETPY